VTTKFLQRATVVRAAGGSWDYKAKLWRIPRRIAGILKLADRIVEKQLLLEFMCIYVGVHVATCSYWQAHRLAKEI
jgi:hypothetical protein